YKDPAGGSSNAFTNWAGVYGLDMWKDVMGAAFNINLLLHDPGGYSHNRYYVKRLLWDSMDFMTDGTLGNIDMAATIDGLASLTALQKTEAKAYLGTARP
ncbi:MAG: C-type polyheme cytochrome OmcB, partial [Proteobacteria bacterium]|nr:C-type polyheme cytochrome OmcB [Pseudomonadota bacterium]